MRRFVKPLQTFTQQVQARQAIRHENALRAYLASLSDEELRALAQHALDKHKEKEKEP